MRPAIFRVIFRVAFLSVFIVLPAVALAVDVAKWSTCDLNFTAGTSYSNGYTSGPSFTTTFTGPGGITQSVSGFWDGGSNFKVRFTPTVEGSWSYTTSSSDAGLNGRTGSVNAVAPLTGDHGFLRIDPNSSNSFVWDDGTRYFMEGQTYYDWIGAALVNDNWKTSVDNSMAYGFNKIRFHVYAQGDYDSTTDVSYYPDAQPYTGTKTAPNRNSLNLTYWQKLDEMVQYMDSKGMVADLIVTTPYESNRMYGTDTQNDRFVKYVAARYAAYPNVIWCMANEWEASSWYSGTNIQDQSDFNRMGGLVRNGDPWIANNSSLRPLSIHNMNIDFQFFDASWPTHAVIQYHPDTPTQDQTGNGGITNNLGHNMPVVNDEYRYIGRLTRIQNRWAMWSIAAAGGYSSTADFRLHPNGMGVPECTGDWNDNVPEEYGDIKRMVDFFTTKGIEYWKMSSQNPLITAGTRAYCLAETGRQYVIYDADGGAFSVNLATGTYHAYQYDPRTGTETDLGAFTTTGGSRSFSVSSGNDWVVRLTTIPEPNTMTLLGAGLVGLGIHRWRKRRT
jgi:hypothetical protein